MIMTRARYRTVKLFIYENRRIVARVVTSTNGSLHKYWSNPMCYEFLCFHVFLHFKAFNQYCVSVYCYLVSGPQGCNRCNKLDLFC